MSGTKTPEKGITDPFSLDDSFFQTPQQESVNQSSSLPKMSNSIWDIPKEDLVLSPSEIQGLAEGSLYPEEVDKSLENLMSAWGVNDAKERNQLTVRLLTYLIENAPSVRGRFEKDIKLGNKRYPSSMITKHIGADLRRWFYDERIVKLCFEIMKNNPELADRMARSWGVYDRRLHKFCFESSHNLPDELLTAADRTLILNKRRTAIRQAGLFIRADVDTATVDNSERSTGASRAAERDAGRRPVHEFPESLAYD
jgi:hypothetical protein